MVLGIAPDGLRDPGTGPSALAMATTMPNSLSEDSPFRAGVLPETQVLLAGHDLLTGLSSRAGLEAHFRLAAARARRCGGRLAVGIADIVADPRAPADDVFGADLVVRDAARRLRRVLRETDLVARIAETRFAFVAEDVTTDGIGVIVERVAGAIARAGSTPAERVDVRVGIAVADSDTPTLPALLRAAEERLGGASPADALLWGAANAESFGNGGDSAAAPRGWSLRGVARRTLGWVSLVTLIVLALAAAPAEWRAAWEPLGALAQDRINELVTRLPWFAERR
jgi:diguanylate cyclase (GGDEF)-like protein